MTAATRLNFITLGSRTLNDAGNLFGILGKGHGNRGHRTVSVVDRRRSQGKEGVALESHEARVLTDCREEAVVARDTMGIPHPQRVARSCEGVDGVES